jgi:hypothetical protein
VVLEKAVRERRQRDTSASAAGSWALLGSSRAWSLRPGLFAFDVAESAGPGRLLFVIRVGDDDVECQVWRAVEEQPDRLIRWQCLSAAPGRSQIVTLDVTPIGSGATTSISITGLVPRGQAGSARTRAGLELSQWLDTLCAVLEDGAPLPGAGIPVGIAHGFADSRTVRRANRVSASVLIDAAPEVVWEDIYAPESRVRDDPEILYAGHVPGTPRGEPGEMQYFVYQESDGRMTGDVIVVQNVIVGHTALVRQITFPYAQIDHLVSAKGNGTRLELTCIVSADAQQARRKIARHLLTVANGYKEHIEKSTL